MGPAGAGSGRSTSVSSQLVGAAPTRRSDYGSSAFPRPGSTVVVSVSLAARALDLLSTACVEDLSLRLHRLHRVCRGCVVREVLDGREHTVDRFLGGIDVLGTKLGPIESQLEEAVSNADERLAVLVDRRRLRVEVPECFEILLELRSSVAEFA